MAGIPLKQSILEAVVADWRTGQYSQDKLAEKHKISKGAVNRVCKGVSRDLVDLVKSGITYKIGIAELCDYDDDYAVPAVTEAVELRTAQITFFNTAQGNLARIALKRIQQKLGANGEPNEEFSMAELAQASNIVTASRIGILGKDPEVQITNTNAQQNNKFTYEVVK